MKTFKEFLEEAYLVEMRKEDKVAGKKKTPLYTTVRSARVERQPEGGDTKWKVKKSEKKTVSPEASLGRYKQGMIDKTTNPYASNYDNYYSRHAHGGGGSGAKAPGKKRGVGKLEQQKIDKAQRERGERPIGSGPSPEYKVALKKSQRARSMGGGQ